MHTATRWIMGILGVTALGVGWALAQNRGEAVAPETLLPATSAVYFSTDGLAAHQEAWEQTAAYDSLVASGLMAGFEKMIASLGAAAQQNPQAAQVFELVTSAVDTIRKNGLSFAASGSLAAPPVGVLVVHEGAGLGAELTQFITNASRGRINLAQSEFDGREVTSTPIPNSPAEVAWWSEGPHLVVAVGIQPAQQIIAVAKGDKPDITTHRLWGKYNEMAEGTEQTTVGWVDTKALQESFGGIPTPFPVEEGEQPVQVRDLLAALGLDSLEEIAVQAGFEGRSCRTKTSYVAPSPRHGLMLLGDQQPITLADLPPLPATLTTMWATSFDAGAGAKTIIDTIHKVTAFGPPSAREEFDDALADADEAVGLSIQQDLLDPLGNVHCFYNDMGQGFFGMGLAFVSKVDDADRLRQSLDHLLERIVVESRGKVEIQRVDKLGREIVMLKLPEAPFAPALCVDDNWLCIGLSPQIVESFLMRLDGKLDKWQPSDEVTALLADMPKEFVSISMSDPRPAYQMLLTWGPTMAGMFEMGMKQQGALPRDFELPFNMSDIPPAELVTGPLHMNIHMQTTSEAGGESISKSSLTGIPLIGGGGGPSVATTSVLVALLLPAVQQAREAARRTQSKNNLKQIMLAMHNYHDTFNHFPQGTVPNDDLKPDKRLSWEASILPYIDQAPLYNQLDMKAGWEARQNAQFQNTQIPIYQNPSAPAGPGQTTYAGCAGVGKDGPTLAANHKRAGIFAYDRATKLRDITDGTSNTMAVFEVDAKLGKWIEGGPSTIRPLTQEPYINGPDGIGGKHAGGVNAAFADGAVRFISEKIDPDTMKALATQAGGEVIGDF